MGLDDKGALSQSVRNLAAASHCQSPAAGQVPNRELPLSPVVRWALFALPSSLMT